MAKKKVIKEKTKEIIPKKESKNKGNLFGILGICVGWLIPILGIIFGIVALIKKEDKKWIGIVAIIESIIFWIIASYYLYNFYL